MLAKTGCKNLTTKLNVYSERKIHSPVTGHATNQQCAQAPVNVKFYFSKRSHYRYGRGSRSGAIAWRPC
jgi:hypothetical protein